MKFRLFFASLAVCFVASTASASISYTLSPADINGGDTTTASYSDAYVTLTPLKGGSPDTFNADADRLGIDGYVTNNAAFGGNGTGSYNTTFGDFDDESLRFDFAPGAGLLQISWDFARADGPLTTDGVQISGFLSDPGAVLTGEVPTAVDSSSVSYSAGTINLQLSGADFGNPDGFLTFSNPAASYGQTLLLTVADSTQTGGQFPITSISVSAVPEPGSLAMLGLLGVAAVGVRRRKSVK